MLYKTSSKQTYEWHGMFSAMQLTKQRFENLEIWKISIEIAKEFCCIAEQLENRQMDKFLDYMKEICLHISNTIAEASDNIANKHIKQTLTKSHLLILEAENIIMILHEQGLIESAIIDSLLNKIQTLGEKVLEYQQHSEGKYMLNNY